MVCKSRASASGRTLGEGSTALARRARTKASILSVLASWPMALAKSRACRGLTTATAIPAEAMEVAARRSKRPVASRTTNSGPTPSRLERSWSTPSWSLVSTKDSPWGRRHTSRVLLETSMPTWTSCFGVGLTVWLILPVGVGPALLIRACSAGLEHWPRQPFGLLQKADATTGAVLRSWRSLDQGGIGLSRPCWPHCERPEPRYKEDELRDYERLSASGEALVYAAMISLMTRRLVHT